MKENKRNPWAWIPTLYFAEALPYVAVMTISVIMYKKLEISNTDIALYTGWLYLPWVIKPFWSPFVDLIKTKRWWTVTMQLLIAIAFACIAFALPTSFFFQLTLAAFWLVAFTQLPMTSLPTVSICMAWMITNSLFSWESAARSTVLLPWQDRAS